MKRHTITEAEVNEWCAGNWVQFAASSSANNVSNKRFEMNMEGLYRVKDHDRILYLGGALASAINEYNSAP
jgi:hypothetical protein